MAIIKENSILSAGNAGLVTTADLVAGDLCHTLSNGASARITKIMAYNNTGADATIIFGTLDNSVVALFVPEFPAILALNTFDAQVSEEFIVAHEFFVDNRALILGRTGDIYVLASVAGITVRIEVEEYRG